MEKNIFTVPCRHVLENIGTQLVEQLSDILCSIDIGGARIKITRI